MADFPKITFPKITNEKLFVAKIYEALVMATDFQIGSRTLIVNSGLVIVTGKQIGRAHV